MPNKPPIAATHPPEWWREQERIATEQMRVAQSIMAENAIPLRALAANESEAERLLDICRELQTRLWETAHELETILGWEIDLTQDLKNQTIASLTSD